MTTPGSNWSEVTRENPCKACGRVSWCRFSGDGAFLCRRVGSEGATALKDKHGSAYYMTFPNGKVPAQLADYIPEPKPEPASPDRLHRFYSELLAHLTLGKQHAAQLAARGFEPGEIERLGAKTFDQVGRLMSKQLADLFPWWDQVPGMALKEGRPALCGWPGLLVPCKDAKGRIVGLRVRADSPDAPKYSWLSSTRHGGPGPGSPLSYWPGSRSDLVRVTEGELKAAFAAARTGIPTICAPGVSLFGSVPLVDLLLELQAQAVFLAPDADFRTNPHVYRSIRNALSGLQAASFKVVLEVWDGPAKGIDDALLSGALITTITPEEFLTMTAPPTRVSVPTEPTAQDWEIPWPAPIAQEAYIGVLGDITQTLEPHTEADPAAIMLQAVAMVGHLIGAGPHFKVEGTRHGTNEYVVLVGTTSKGRKGTSWGRVREIGAAALGFGPEGLQTINGLGSGEALVSMLADRAEDRDASSLDVSNRKRLLIMESEYAQVLKVASREGNTVSPTLRAAWDGEALSNLTKGEKYRSTGHHLSMIGHITSQELRELLSNVEVANGTANRNLVGVVKRSKYLPEGGALGESEVEQLGQQLRLALERVRQRGKVSVVREDSARRLWAELYRPLSDGLPGLAGAILARGEAHVTRLSLIYALLDGSTVVRVQHLLAALAIWDYCVGSVLYLFGDKIGDGLADRILAELRHNSEGLTRTEISKLFQGNKSSADLTRSLHILEEQNLATKSRERGPDPNQKRPVEKWHASNGIKFVNFVGGKSVPSYLQIARSILSGGSYEATNY